MSLTQNPSATKIRKPRLRSYLFGRGSTYWEKCYSPRPKFERRAESVKDPQYARNMNKFNQLAEIMRAQDVRRSTSASEGKARKSSKKEPSLHGQRQPAQAPLVPANVDDPLLGEEYVFEDWYLLAPAKTHNWEEECERLERERAERRLAIEMREKTETSAPKAPRVPFQAIIYVGMGKHDN